MSEENAEPVFTPPGQEAQVKLEEPVLPQGSVLMACIGGLIPGIVGALLWAALALASQRTFGLLAIGLGFIVGIGVRVLGKGTGPQFRVIGALISLFSCGLGYFFTLVGFGAKEAEMGYFAFLSEVPFSALLSALGSSLGGLDYLFLAFAAWFGWKYSSR